MRLNLFGQFARTLSTLLKNGVSANPIMYPAVKEKLARLRFFITTLHTPMQIPPLQSQSTELTVAPCVPSSWDGRSTRSRTTRFRSDSLGLASLSGD